MEKPDPRIFELALKTSGISNLRPEDCLHIGDKPLLDYRAAKNAGWNAVLVNEGDFVRLNEKCPELDQNSLFGSAYQLHISMLKKSGDKLPTPEQELN